MRWPSAVDELLEQRDAILFGEWTNGTPKSEGQACLAIRVCDNGLVEHIYESVHLVRQAIENIEGSADFAIGNWNDTPGRTKEEVLAVLDEAIRIAKCS